MMSYRRSLLKNQTRPVARRPWIQDVRGQWRDALRHLSGEEYGIAVWGTAVIACMAFALILPPSYLLYLPTIFGAILLIRCLFGGRPIIPKSWPFLMALVLQLWSFATAINANMTLGRPVALGRADTYLLHGIVPGAVAWIVASLAPDWRKIAMRIFLWAFGLSSVVAWLQFARFPGAVALSRMYTYKAIDNWDGHPGIRAVGLSSQPNHLAFQALVGLALACGAVLIRPLTFRQYGMAILFTGAAVFSQARAAFPALILAWGAFIVCAFLRDRKQGTRLVGILLAGFLVLMPVAGKRFSYMMMTSSGGDASLDFRATQTWSQVNDILPRFPTMGIGPSGGLLLGSGQEDKWVPIGRPVESAYLVCQAMYGVPGLCLFVAGLAGGVIFSIVSIRRSRDPVQKVLLTACLVCAVEIVFNAYSFNTIDSYLHLPLIFLLSGMAAAPPKGSSIQARWKPAWSIGRTTEAATDRPALEG